MGERSADHVNGWLLAAKKARRPNDTSHDSSPTPANDEKCTARELIQIGRHKVYATSFAQCEDEIRQRLQAMLGQFGFNHETGIKAIPVNRKPHGYHELDNPEWPTGLAPHEIGRAQFGRISITNSDSEARAYVDAAFDAAW
jgi:spermidine dehydrogenase